MDTLSHKMTGETKKYLLSKFIVCCIKIYIDKKYVLKKNKLFIAMEITSLWWV